MYQPLGRSAAGQGHLQRLQGEVLGEACAQGQPTTSRANRSGMTARASQPPLVQVCVISVTQVAVGAAVVNCRATTFVATGRAWFESIVTRKRRRRPAKPCCRINRATRLRLRPYPRARSYACTRGL